MKGKTKFLFVCKANVNRSKMAVAIFNSKIRERNLHNYCSAESAGVLRKPMPAEHSYVDSALRRAHYDITDHHDPRPISSNLANWADIIFSINTEVADHLENAFGSNDEIMKKIRILPHYGLSTEKRKDDIFDPKYLLVSSEDARSSSQPFNKRAVGLVLKLTPPINFVRRAVNWGVYNFTPYTPLSKTGYHEEIISLCMRTIRELEPCIEGAIERMQEEYLLPKNK